MTGIEWLGTPQMAIAAIALAILTITASEYWLHLRKKKKVLEAKINRAIERKMWEAKANAIKETCIRTLSLFAPHILRRLEMSVEVEEYWEPRLVPKIFLIITIESADILRDIESTIHDELREFRSLTGNHEIDLTPVFRVKGENQ